MDIEKSRKRLEGCYITVPTMFRDPDLELDVAATRRNVGFLVSRGITEKYGVFLAGGAAGDFSTMTFDERERVVNAVAEEAAGRVPVAMGAQTTSTLELKRLAKAAQKAGAEFIQVSRPFYFAHTEEDFYEYVCVAAEAADIGIIIYNTFWSTADISFKLVERLAAIPNVVGLKWATPRSDSMEFEDVIVHFAKRFTFIDNNLKFPASHVLGARAYEVHLCNYWPEWGIKLIDDLEAGRFAEAQLSLASNALPFYKLWLEIEANFTSGDGYLDKLCMELVGLDSSRCRPPTRDIRATYRERCRRMLIESRVPGVLAA
ncbi:MAG: dihydrodipicolinate synthase family protein [Rhizobiales bacterium]|nr:dihydrodipicolinate synthase family protein [Hyphomicrobiales bacterium]MBI3674237.1 dihydrodipicolinate synthase family protein [Hyphomicrobiales bacterium]